MSGTYSDLSGRGSLIATRMAVEDFGAAAKGMKVEIVGADHQNKPDVGSNIVRKWIDTGKVDVIVDVPTSSVALAVNEIVRDKNKVFLVSGGATSDLTGAKCTPNTIHWTYDTWALANGTGQAIVKTGGDTWFFLTANYAFLNYLVLVLGVLLVDDAAWERLGWRPVAACPAGQPRTWRLIAVAATLAWVFYATLVAFMPRAVPRPLLTPALALEPLRIANRYGLFAVMTRARFEIEFQGSRDGKAWVAYPFRYKPQDPMRAPGIYAPYQPRFEWNLWFASLASWETYPWVLATEARLLAAEPAVLRLFAGDPFRGERPRAVRAVLWQYWFTDRATRARTGAWWRRRFLGLYAPQIDDSTILPNEAEPGAPGP